MSYLFTNGCSQLLYGKIATVTVVRPRFLRFGELDINKDQVARFAEKAEYAGNYVNGGFFVFNRNCRFSDYYSRKPAFFIGLNKSTC